MRYIAGFTLGILLAFATTAANAASLGEEEACALGVDAYLYFYPIITMDITRKQLTNEPPGPRCQSAGRRYLSAEPH